MKQDLRKIASPKNPSTKLEKPNKHNNQNNPVISEIPRGTL